MSAVAEQRVTPLRASAGAMSPSSSSPRRAERRLAEQLRSGDVRALDAFHAHLGSAVFGYVRHVLRDRDAAEDVYQQVLTEVWRRAGQYDARRGSLITWALTIARSRVIDELRRRRPEPVDPAELPELAELAPQDSAIDRWRMAHLLARLPAEQRELLRLRFYCDLSQTEIAVQTGLALGTIKGRMVRGLHRLRELLDEEGLA